MPFVHGVHPGKMCNRLTDRGDRRRTAIHPDARPQRAVMYDIGIGDRTDDARRARTECDVQHILKEDDARFGVHAVVGSKSNDRACIGQTSAPHVERGVEPVGYGAARRMFVLHVVGERKIRQIWSPAFE